jgi:hypothetical protein
MKVLKRIGIQLLGIVLLFSFVVSVGTSVVLLLASCIGYLSYSDRPGPGWQTRIHWPAWGEAGVYLGFAPWFAYFCLIMGLALFVLALILGWMSTPKWLNRILGGIFSALTGSLAVTGAGWYLALAPIGTYAAMALGLLYGIFLFPKFIATREKPFPLWVRWSIITVVCGLFLFWIISPFIPHKPVPGISFSIIRLTPSEKIYKSNEVQLLGEANVKQVNALQLKGDVHGGLGGGSSAGDNSLMIDVSLIALEPITTKSELLLPESGSVVYVLKDRHWAAYPAIQKKDKRKLIIGPALSKEYDGGHLKIGKTAGDDFAWYPVIPKGS